MYKVNKIAVVLGIGILLLFIICLIAVRQIVEPSDIIPYQTADIYHNGILVESISLGMVSETWCLTLVSENGNVNEIEIRPGEIGMLYADCPDQLCVKQGFISNSHLPITCLPNRVVITLRNTDGVQPDAVTY